MYSHETSQLKDTVYVLNFSNTNVLVKKIPYLSVLRLFEINVGIKLPFYTLQVFTLNYERKSLMVRVSRALKYMYLNSSFYKTLESKTLKLENIGNATFGFPLVHWAIGNIKIIRA